MHSGPTHRGLWLFAALALAVVVRGALLAEKPFWRDEAWVAILVEAPLQDSYARPRAVPVGFVAVTKLTRALPLSPEVAYRLLPLLGGLLSVLLLGALARALGAAGSIPLVAVWLAAGTPALVYYSREIKSYGLDALLAIAVPLLALHLFGRAAPPPGATPPGRAAPAASGAVLVALLVLAPWITFGSLFPIAATLAWGWLAWWRGATPAARRWWLAATAAYGASFAVAYRFTLSAQSTNPSLREWWKPQRFADAPGSLLDHAVEASWRYASVLVEFTFHELWWLALPLMLLGAYAWPRRGRAFLLWSLVACAAATVAAALADRYLIAQGRLLLFGVPALLLLAAAGLDALARRLWPARAATLALGVAALFALGWSAAGIAHRLPPQHNDVETYFRYDILHDITPLLDAATRLVSAGEPVYISEYSSRPFAYYRDGRFPDATICDWTCVPHLSAQEWGGSLSGRGWAFVVDDESAMVANEFRKLGVTVTPAATARGMALWEVRGAGEPVSE